MGAAAILAAGVVALAFPLPGGGEAEVLNVGTSEQTPRATYRISVRSGGETLADFSVPLEAYDVNEDGIVEGWVTPLALSDVDRDGRIEVLVGRQTGYDLFPRDLTLHDSDGRVRWRVPFATWHVDASAADLDGDGVEEFVVSGYGPTNGRIGGSVNDVHASVVCIGADGRHRWVHRFGGYYSGAHFAVADLDGDGRRETVVGLFTAVGYRLDLGDILVIDAEGAIRARRPGGVSVDAIRVEGGEIVATLREGAPLRIRAADLLAAQDDLPEADDVVGWTRRPTVRSAAALSTSISLMAAGIAALALYLRRIGRVADDSTEPYASAAVLAALFTSAIFLPPTLFAVRAWSVGGVEPYFRAALLAESPPLAEWRTVWWYTLLVVAPTILLTGFYAAIPLGSIVLWRFASEIVAASRRLSPVPPEPRWRRLHEAVEAASREAGVALPRLYLDPRPGAGAFAFGSAASPSLAVTADLAALDEDDLRRALLHEAAHMRNGDLALFTWTEAALTALRLGMIPAVAGTFAAYAAAAAFKILMRLEHFRLNGLRPPPSFEPTLRGLLTGDLLIGAGASIALLVALFVIPRLVASVALRDRELHADAFAEARAGGLAALLRRIAGGDAALDDRLRALADGRYFVRPGEAALPGLGISVLLGAAAWSFTLPFLLPALLGSAPTFHLVALSALAGLLVLHPLRRLREPRAEIRRLWPSLLARLTAAIGTAVAMWLVSFALIVVWKGDYMPVLQAKIAYLAKVKVTSLVLADVDLIAFRARYRLLGIVAAAAVLVPALPYLWCAARDAAVGRRSGYARAVAWIAASFAGFFILQNLWRSW